MALPAPPAGAGGMLFGGGGGDLAAAVDPTAPLDVGGGKNNKAQHLISPHAGIKSTLAKGEPLSRSMGQYGKGHSFSASLKQIRGGQGGMRSIRGGLGPGKQGQPGPASNYSMKTGDTE